MQRDEIMWGLYKQMGRVVHQGLQTTTPWMYDRARKTSRSGYDPDAYAFVGGELEHITSRNYEKSLRKIWKAEIKAPFLGFKDATNVEKAELQQAEEAAETRELTEVATSRQVLKEFEEAYTPEQRAALGRILSLIGHGEAYALYTSANILTFVKGTGARMGMAMQVMEEAKHFIVLRKMLQTLGIATPPSQTVYMLFERIASAPPYRMIFGMNIVLESLATSIFSTFADAPGLRHIMHPFHMDEARHVGFVRSYSSSNNLPRWVTYSPLERQARTKMILPALPAIWEFKEDFEILGIDTFEFFGSTLHKIGKLASETGFPLVVPNDYFLALLNGLFNGYVRAYEPEKFAGFRDYTRIGDSSHIPAELLAVERKLFGEEIFQAAG